MSSGAENTVVAVRDLRMRYGTTDVLMSVDFEIRRREVVTLLGPHGAGKTTTIEIIAGCRARSGGEVEVLVLDPARAVRTQQRHSLAPANLKVDTHQHIG